MNTKLFLYSATLLLSLTRVLPVFAQGIVPITKADSLATLLKTDQDDTNKVNHLNGLGWEMMYQNPDTAILMGKQALEIATSLHLGKVRGWAKGIAETNNKLGVYYYLKGDYVKSLEYYFIALKLNEEIGNKKDIAATLNNIGLVFRFQGDHAKALEYYFKSLKLNSELGSKKYIALNLNNIGLVYNDLHDYSKALEYYRKALRLNQDMGNKNTVATNFNNIGNVYYAKGNYSIALNNYFKALKLNEEIGNTNETANNLGNIGTTYMKSNNNPKALEYFLKALKLNEYLGNKYLIAANLGNIGEVYFNKNKYKDAEQNLLKALEISKEIGALELIKEHNELLSKLYSKTNRYELAYEHYQQFTIAKDSLFNEDKSKEIGRLEMRHEIEKVERDRKLKEEEVFRISKQKKERKHLLQYSGMFIGLLGIGLIIMMLGFVKVSPPMARSVSFFGFLLLFEFILLLVDPYIDKYSGGEPLYQLIINAILAACIFPLNAIMERGIKKRLIK